MLALPQAPQGGLPQKEVTFSGSGAIVVHHHIGLPPEIGYEITRYDYLIQNRHWRHLGPILPTREELAAREQAPCAPLKGVKSAVRQNQWDSAPQAQAAPGKMPKWKGGGTRANLSRTGNIVAHVLQSEVLDERGVRDFFSQPEVEPIVSRVKPGCCHKHADTCA
ncbi:unnamed protein product [Effrenium voratum]|nr:unnamed protein product [Effrenium voratum]